MARASARFTASTSVTSAMGSAFDLVPLHGIDIRQPGVEVIEHARRLPGRRGQIALDGYLDLTLAIGDEPLLFGFGPRLSADEVSPQARDRFFLPARLHVFGHTIARGVIGGGVIPKPV